jgi:hypothetical protein
MDRCRNEKTAYLPLEKTTWARPSGTRRNDEKRLVIAKLCTLVRGAHTLGYNPRRICDELFHF